VWTYADGLGLEPWNLLSSIGAFVVAAGVAVVLIDLILHLRVAGRVDANPWNAGTLEWLPQENQGLRSIPRIESRNPLWDRPSLREEVDRGQHYLPQVATGERETLVTHPIDASPQYILRVPGPSWLPLLAGFGTAAFFLLLTVKQFVAAGIGAAIALVSLFRWLWGSDPAPGTKLHPIGDDIHLPDYASGTVSHAWWATVVLMLVDGAIFASLVFSFFYLWTVAPAGWPPVPLALPDATWSIATTVTVLMAGAAMVCANRLLRGNRTRPAFNSAHGVGLILLWGSLLCMLQSLRIVGLQPHEHSFPAVGYTLTAWQGLHVVLLTLMGGYVIARSSTGRLDAGRRVTFDTYRLLWHYSVWQGVIALAIINSPRFV
jgi:cytochrome c oxidase subunit I+III